MVLQKEEFEPAVFELCSENKRVNTKLNSSMSHFDSEEFNKLQANLDLSRMTCVG